MKRSRMHIPWHEFKSIPNIITLIRFAFIPIMAVVMLRTKGHGMFGFALFLGIWVTDVLDGFIARRYNMITSVGKVLDPLVDKVFHITTALCLFLTHRLPLWVLILILIKDVLMIIGATLLFARQQVVYATWPGKVTTVLFVIAFAAMFFLDHEDPYIVNLMFVPAAIMAIVSFSIYVNQYLKAPR